MVELRYFGLAAVGTLSGLMFFGSGCSGTATGTGTGDGGSSGNPGDTTSGGSSGSATKKDASAKDGFGGGNDPPGSGGCPGIPPASFAWKQPPAAQKVCQQGDIDFISGEAQKGGTFQALEASLKARNAACAKCVFGSETDPRWGPIVYVGTAGAAFFNYGACFATAPGGSISCGQTVQQFELCAASACDATVCGSNQAQSDCVKQVAADKSSCGKYDFQTACPNLQSLNTACNTGLDVIRVMCGP